MNIPIFISVDAIHSMQTQSSKIQSRWASERYLCNLTVWGPGTVRLALLLWLWSRGPAFQFVPCLLPSSVWVVFRRRKRCQYYSQHHSRIILCHRSTTSLHQLQGTEMCLCYIKYHHCCTIVKSHKVPIILRSQMTLLSDNKHFKILLELIQLMSWQWTKKWIREVVFYRLII